MASAHKLRLISFDTCPFVERSRIVLAEKQLAYDVTFVDLKTKPDWFLEISPLSKVPVLLVDERPVFESMVINELLDELYPERPLMPADPMERAEARGWTVFCNDVVMLTAYRAQVAMVARAIGAPGDATKAVDAMTSVMGTLERHLSSNAGPHFLGKNFSLVDAAYAPFLRRWRLADAEPSLLSQFPRLFGYASTLLARPSVQAAEPEHLAEKQRAFLEGKARATVTG